MKLLLISVFCFFLFAFLIRPRQKSMDNAFPNTLFKKFKGDTIKCCSITSALLATKRTNKSANVALLPQDHMPCIIPDTNAIKPMPNAWSGITIPYQSPYPPIPNPALTPKYFPSNPLDNNIDAPSK